MTEPLRICKVSIKRAWFYFHRKGAAEWGTERDTFKTDYTEVNTDKGTMIRVYNNRKESRLIHRGFIC